MALTSCRECGKRVGSEAPTCPHCGTPDPAGARAARARRDRNIGLLGCGASLLMVLAFCVAVQSGPDEEPASSYATPAVDRVTPERFSAVAAALEQEPGVRVERDPAAPRTMRIHLSRTGVTREQAQQIGAMARSRLGEDAIVYVYGPGRLRLARVTAYGAE